MIVENRLLQAASLPPGFHLKGEEWRFSLPLTVSTDNAYAHNQVPLSSQNSRFTPLKF